MDTVTESTEAPTFEEYAGAAWPSLYRSPTCSAGAHADAEDLAQQTLLKAYRSWPRVEQAAYAGGVHASHPHQRLPVAEAAQGAPARGPHRQAPGQQSRPPSGVEERMTLWPHVKSLPPRQRAVVVLRYYEDTQRAERSPTCSAASRGNREVPAHHALTSLRKAIATQDGDAQDGTES